MRSRDYWCLTGSLVWAYLPPLLVCTCELRARGWTAQRSLLDPPLRPDDPLRELALCAEPERPLPLREDALRLLLLSSIDEPRLLLPDCIFFLLPAMSHLQRFDLRALHTKHAKQTEARRMPYKKYAENQPLERLAGNPPGD